VHYVRLTAATPLPVTLAEAKQHLKLEPTDTEQDDLVEGLLVAAVESLDGRDGLLNRALLTQAWEAYADRPQPDDSFVVGLGPDPAVSRLERLVDGAWTEVPAGDYVVRPIARRRAAIIPAAGKSWPAADDVPSAWKITFQAGFGPTSDHVPAPIKAAIKIALSDLFEGREGGQNPTVWALVGPYSNRLAG
jgi:uncharacterized phiE125 gp8 family phage protein